MKGAENLTLRVKHKDWIVLISTEDGTEVPVGTLTMLSHIAEAVTNILAKTPRSSLSGLSANLEILDTSGWPTDTTSL